jgi:elongation factor G
MSDALVIEIAVEPKAKADWDKLADVLARLTAADPSLGVSIAFGQAIIKGTSERHLDIAIDSLLRTHKIDVRVGAPQIAYRETITCTANVDYTHKKRIGAAGQFARVTLQLEPLPLGSGFEFKCAAPDNNSLPADYVAGVETSIRAALEDGVVAGFPVVDLRATLRDGVYHDRDSSVLAFEVAARAAFREAMTHGRPTLLEPMMKIEVTTPADCVRAVLDDLGARRARLTGKTARGDIHVVTAMVPLGCMFGYDSSLAALSRQQATYEMTFSHYDPVPSPDEDGTFPPAVGMRA